MATDETSIQGNPLAGQPQSNLWFGDYEDLKNVGAMPAGMADPGSKIKVKANTPSDPFLVAGFDRRMIHLSVDRIPELRRSQEGRDDSEVTFSLQVDRKGNGTWTDFEKVAVRQGGYVAHILPESLDAVWLRLVVNRDCLATAFLHQTTGKFVNGNSVENKALFSGIAGVDDRGTARASSRASMARWGSFPGC